MNNLQHKKQSEGIWQSKCFFEQMANIGSEVYRAINWRNKGNEEYSQIAFLRSLELFDLSKESKLTISQFRELTRMREIWVDFFKYDNQYNSTEDQINKYFMYSTLAFKNMKKEN